MYYTLIPFDLLATIPRNQFHSRNTQVDNRRENFYQGASSKLLLLYSLHLQIRGGRAIRESTWRDFLPTSAESAFPVSVGKRYHL